MILAQGFDPVEFLITLKSCKNVPFEAVKDFILQCYEKHDADLSKSEFQISKKEKSSLKARETIDKMRSRPYMLKNKKCTRCGT